MGNKIKSHYVSPNWPPLGGVRRLEGGAEEREECCLLGHLLIDEDIYLERGN